MNFTGTGVAIVTPMDAQLKVDYTSLEKQVNHLINGKVEYLVVMGTTGENATLTQDEKREVCRFVSGISAGRVPVVFGVGGNDTIAVAHQLEKLDTSGIDAILSVVPYYNKPVQKGIYAHFSCILKSSPLPVILYNVPSRTGLNMTAETTLKLAHDYANAVAVKEASGNIEQIMHIIQHKPERFHVISGDDALTYPLIAVGASGVISVVANVIPAIFSSMVRNALKGNHAEAVKEHYSTLKLTSYMFAEGSPAGAKAALKIMGITEEFLRLPLVGVSDELKQKIEAELIALKIL